jgi:hypothetical protein
MYFYINAMFSILLFSKVNNVHYQTSQGYLAYRTQGQVWVFGEELLLFLKDLLLVDAIF